MSKRKDLTGMRFKYQEVDVRENYKLIAEWAKEIQHLASLEAELEHLRRKEN